MSKILDVLNSPWAIEAAKLDEIVEIYATHLRGEKIDLTAIEANLGRPLANEQQGYEVRDGVAIIPIEGVIAKRMNLFSRISGGASTELAERDVKASLVDPRVHSIVLRIDSPGGSIEGIQELATVIHAARSSGKRIATLADSKMASAAYWIGAAASEVYMTGYTTIMGDIGVVTKHVNIKKAEEKSGLETTEIYSGKYKRIASELGPLSEEGRAYIQSKVDHIYTVFVDDVARFRGVSSETALEKMADGRAFIGQQAIDAGLADGVLSLDALIAHLIAGTKPGKQSEGSRAAGAAAAEASTQLKVTGDTMTITKDFITANHADIAEAFRAEGRQQGLTEGREAGATAERARIQGVEAATLPGHDALIATLKYDGKTTPGDAALQVNQAERAKLGGKRRDIEADAGKLDIKGGASELGEQRPKDPIDAHADKTKPVEERCKAAWDADPKIRAEFTTLTAYTAVVRAEESGQVRVFGARKAV